MSWNPWQELSQWMAGVLVVSGIAWAVIDSIIVCMLIGSFRVFRLPSRTGREELIGQTAVADTDLAPDGQVFIHGEIWSAQAGSPVRRGARARVHRVEGLRLFVEPISAAASSSDAVEST